MEYFDFSERTMVLLDADFNIAKDFNVPVKHLSSIEITGRVGLPNGFIKRTIRRDIQSAVRYAVAMQGANAIGVESTVCDRLEEIGYKGVTCELLSMIRNIYPVGEKEEKVDLMKRKMFAKKKQKTIPTKRGKSCKRFGKNL